MQGAIIVDHYLRMSTRGHKIKNPAQGGIFQYLFPGDYLAGVAGAILLVSAAVAAARESAEACALAASSA